MFDITEIEEEQIKKDFIINGIMRSKGIYCLVANAKVGKSMFSLQLSDSLANNKQFSGLDVMSTPVLYITTECDKKQILDRCKLLGITFSKGRFFIIDRNGKGNIDLKDNEWIIKKFAEDYNGKVIIFDMLKDIDLGVGYDMNSYQDINQLMMFKLREIAEKYNLTILFTHHLNKQGKTLGSTAFDATSDGVITLIEDKNDKSLVKLKMINRDFPELELQLKKSKHQVFSVIEPVEDNELDYNLVELIKYCAKKIDLEFTCTEIVERCNLKTTAKRLGRLINSNIDLLKSEGLTITKARQGNARNYIGHYEEPVIENNQVTQ